MKFDILKTSCNACGARIPRDYDHQCGGCGEHVCNTIDANGHMICKCAVCFGDKAWCPGCQKEIPADKELCDACNAKWTAMLEDAKGTTCPDDSGQGVCSEDERPEKLSEGGVGELRPDDSTSSVETGG